MKRKIINLIIIVSTFSLLMCFWGRTVEVPKTRIKVIDAENNEPINQLQIYYVLYKVEPRWYDLLHAPEFMVKAIEASTDENGVVLIEPGPVQFNKKRARFESEMIYINIDNIENESNRLLLKDNDKYYCLLINFSDWRDVGKNIKLVDDRYTGLIIHGATPFENDNYSKSSIYLQDDKEPLGERDKIFKENNLKYYNYWTNLENDKEIIIKLKRATK